MYLPRLPIVASCAATREKSNICLKAYASYYWRTSGMQPLSPADTPTEGQSRPHGARLPRRYCAMSSWLGIGLPWFYRFYRNGKWRGESNNPTCHYCTPIRTYANGLGEERAVTSTRETITEKMRIWRMRRTPRCRLMRTENFLWE